MVACKLIAIINQLWGRGLNSVSWSRKHKAFLNKVKDLELRMAEQESTLENSFTPKNFQIIRHWRAEFRQKTFSA
jgi:hypothetical protein